MQNFHPSVPLHSLPQTILLTPCWVMKPRKRHWSCTCFAPHCNQVVGVTWKPYASSSSVLSGGSSLMNSKSRLVCTSRITEVDWPSSLRWDMSLTPGHLILQNLPQVPSNLSLLFSYDHWHSPVSISGNWTKGQKAKCSLIPSRGNISLKESSAAAFRTLLLIFSFWGAHWLEIRTWCQKWTTTPNT